MTVHSSDEILSTLTAADLMQTDVVTVGVSTPLSEVERMLAEHRISGVPVTDEAGHIVGVLSTKDLLERYAQDPDARPRRGHGFYTIPSNDLLDDELNAFELPADGEETAGQIMTADVFAVAPDDGIRVVCRKMIDFGVHRILVRDGQGTVGLITTLDVLRALATPPPDSQA